MMPPPGWRLCATCEMPVRSKAFPKNWPPERDHEGISQSCYVHQDALPSIAELEMVPGLKQVFPTHPRVEDTEPDIDT